MAESQAGRTINIFCHQCDIYLSASDNADICPSCRTGFFEVVQQLPQGAQVRRSPIGAARGQILIGTFPQFLREGDRQNVRGRGISDTAFNDLPRAQITQEQVESNSLCSICFDGFSVNLEVLKLECNHLFHIDCIRQWLRLHSNCPVCRSNVGSPEIITEEQEIMFTTDDLMRVGARIFVEGLATLSNDVDEIPDFLLADFLGVNTTED